MTGSTVSHYQILERLASGGMGVVYKARDLKLGRLVALKFLSSQRGAPEEEKRRFLREARAASQIDHPNVCTIHEIGETEDGALFIAMALYEGETLRDRLDRGPLSVPQAVNVAAQIAAGLARAHELGIVHRDVKPANILLTSALANDGQVKILDFGIARLADQSRLTRAGMAVGTAAYMSPEQLRGEPADPRSDIWSLGVMIHEMVTGRLPFDDFSEREMVRAILESDPPPLSRLRPGVPEELERIVARALAKQPASRYSSMAALRTALRSLAGPAAPPAPPAPADIDADLTRLELPEPASHAFRTGSPETREGLLGRTVGPYRVLELLGGGGMGVVYKAEDTRLSRTVALKFLPPELTRDPEAKARFMQEARAASSLDLPNLCTILELGETPDGRLYLAMPCYDGETLRRKIERGPLPVAAAADVAEQVARGLAKAHRSGIIHRDIKPANLIVTGDGGDGLVKILDFGLAKLAGSAAMTRTGSSMGTPAYMSPEQARGDEVDLRTDLWSLGVVLYEMLAGRRPFRGPGEPAMNEQAVIHAILNERPRPLREARPEVPPELARIVDRLLARDPADRYASAEEVFAGLRAFRGETMTGTMLARPAAPRRGPSWVWGLAGFVLIAGGLGIWALTRGRPAPRTAPSPTTFTRLTDQEGRESFPSLSPDGGFFVYAKATAPGNLDLYLQRIGGGNPINLTADSPVDDTQPAFSPDGRQIAFRSERDGGGVFVMGATGESVRRATDFGFNPAWSPDGWKLVVATEGVSDPGVRSSTSQLWRVNLATGEKRLLPTEDAVQPSWSPHGTRIAFWGLVSGSRRTIWTVDAEGGDPVPVTDDAYVNWNPVWSPDGRSLYFASNRSGIMNLWRVKIDEGSGRVEGEPEAVTTSSQESTLLSLSRDGRRLVFVASGSKTHLEKVGFDPATGRVTGAAVPLLKSALGIRSCRVSPDGRWIAFHSTVPQEDLFVVRADGTGLRQLTDDGHNDRHPDWSPDGSRLLFYSNRSGRYEAWTIQPGGGGLRRETGMDSGAVVYPVWSPDGGRIAFAQGPRGTVTVDLAKPLPARVAVPVPVQGGRTWTFGPSSWSRDGRRIAGNVREGREGREGPVGIGLYSFDSRTYEKLTPSGNTPVWLSDDRTLVYLDGDEVWAVDTRTKKSWELLASGPDSGFFSASAGPDGRELYVVRVLHEGDVVMLTAK